MPRYAAERILLAPIDDVWAFLADPYRLADWWPGVTGVEPDRRGLAPGARWRVLGPGKPSYLRRPQAEGRLLVLEVAPLERIAFQLTGDRIDVELELQAVDERKTKVSLLVDVPWLIGAGRAYPRRALGRLYSLLQTGAEP